MRDIRDDLKERLAFIEKETNAASEEFQRAIKLANDRHKQKMDALRGAWIATQRLLEVEENRAAARGPVTIEHIVKRQPQVSLPSFLLDTLTLIGPQNKEDLRLLAQKAGYFPEGEGGRAIHAHLVNLSRTGRVEVKEDGSFAVAKSENQPELIK